MVVAAESRAALQTGVEWDASYLLWCRGGNWKLTFLVVPLMGLIGDFKMLLVSYLLEGVLLNGVIVLTRVLSVVTVVH